MTKKPKPKPKPKTPQKIGAQPENKNAEKWTEAKALKLGQGLIDWMKEPEENIFYERYLYFETDNHPCTISYLEKKFKSFSKLIKKAKKMQEIRLFQKGSTKELDTAMSIFCLKANHGMSDKAVEIKINDTDGNEDGPVKIVVNIKENKPE